MALSVMVALILTPALCATILKPAAHGHHEKKGFFGWFNRTFDRATARYGDGVQRMNRSWKRSLLLRLGGGRHGCNLRAIAERLPA
jgi:HAE1 family hydrophobic/amphiphilic exporter-1/multidrug efflux pump